MIGASFSEQDARGAIEAQLRAAGWTLGGDRRDGVALAEVRGADGRISDFLLYVDGRAVGAIETKGARRALGGAGWTQVLRSVASATLPFHYLATGDQTLFLNLRDPDPQPRAIASFQRPETLRRWLSETPLRLRLKELPNAPMAPAGLAPHQRAAIGRLESAFAENRPRTLLVMASGSGKTRVVLAEVARLLEHTRVGRVLWLADRRAVADQMMEVLGSDALEGTGALSTRFPVVFLEGEAVSADARVVVATVQRLAALLGDEQRGATYRPSLPPETFDVIFVDDGDRIARSASWVIDYFDAFVVGVTATPSAAGHRHFNGNAISVAVGSVAAAERTPDAVSRLIAAAIADRHIGRAIDPWVGWGGVLHELRTAVAIDEAIAVAPASSGVALDEANDGITWVFGDPLEALRRAEGEFDLIASTPPFSSRPRHHEMKVGDRVVQVSDTYERIVMLEACSRLSVDGEAYFLVPNNFFWRAGRTAWREMDKLGLYPSAVIGLPMRSNVPVPSTIATSVVIVGRQQHESLFVGQITGDAAYDVEALVRNLRARVPGEVGELGRLVDPAGFIGVHRALEEERVVSWAKRANLHPNALGEISTEINFLSRREATFTEAPNAVYIALAGAPRNGAATSPSELGAKPSSCVQLVLNPELADAEYVAAFLNSERGRLLRASWGVGNVIQRIPRQQIEHKVVYLPDRDHQAEAAALMTTVLTLRTRLAEIEADLADGSADIVAVRAELAAVHDESAWIEGLPFPLASILWKYASVNDPREQIEHLLHFFEGLSMFSATLLLSGFQTDVSFFSDHRPDWIKGVQGLRSSRWGTWTTLHGRLAETVRSMLSQDESRAQCLELFKMTRASVLEALSGQEFEAIINEAREFRNRQNAHGPYNDDRERRRMVTVLEALLQRFRESGAGAFRGFEMLRPQDSRYRGGAYYYNAHSLMGSRREFRTIAVTTTAPMEEGQIYLLDLDTTTPLSLMPLIQVRPGPTTEEDACYFYSGVEDGSVRLISYHFGLEADIQVQDSALISAIETLTARG